MYKKYFYNILTIYCMHMPKVMALCIVSFFLINTLTAQRVVFVSSYSGDYCNSFADPLDEDVKLMNDVFGAEASGGWERFTFDEIDSAAQFLDNTCFLYLDGFCDEWAFGDFYEIYRDDINDFVFNGGNVFINFNEDLAIVVGFDSVYRTAVSNIITGVPYNLNHSIFNGPFNPANGFFMPRYSHFSSLAIGSFNGINMDTLITNWNDPEYPIDSFEAALVERKYGEGIALIANFRIWLWNELLADYKNMRRNTLYYLSGCLHGDTDVGAIYVTNPTAECNLSEDETVGIAVYNYGMQAQSGVTVCYQTDTGAIVCEDFAVNLAPQHIDTVFFTTGADFSRCGNHTVKTWTVLTGDSIADNDTMTMQVENICAAIATIGLPDTVCVDAGIVTPNQETGTGYWSGTGITDAQSGTFDPAMIGLDNSAVVSYSYETPIAYTISTIPYDPHELLNPDTLSMFGGVRDTVALGFRFNYYGGSYDSVIFTDGGYILFSHLNGADSDDGNVNMIALASTDSYLADDCIVSAQGEAPNREFILAFDDVLAWECGTIKAQCILYESTGIIEMHINHLPECDFLIRMGLYSNDHNTIYTRNPDNLPWRTTAWGIEVQDTAFRFTPILCPRTVTDTIYVKGDISVNVLGNDTVFCPGGVLEIGTEYPGTGFLWNTGDTASHIAVSEPGIYTLQMHYGPGDCFLYDTISVEAIESDLFLNVLGNDTALCYGDTLLVEINYSDTIYSFNWSTADTAQTITVTETGDYAIEIEYADGCSLYDTIAVNYASPLIIESVSTPATSGLPNGSITVTVSGGTSPYTLSWSDGLEGFTPDSLYPAIYYLAVSDALGCTAQTDIVVNVGDAVAAVNGNDMLVYPNPFDNALFVKSSSDILEMKLSAINAGSVPVAFTRQSSHTYAVSTDGLPPGLYILQFTTSANDTVRALLVKH